MSGNDSERAQHDMGGLDGGPIDRAEHETTFWEQRVDAIMVLLSYCDPPIMDTAELRRGIESLPADAYENLSYYERWAASIASTVVRKGIVSQDELDKRIAEIKARGGAGP